jgi:hypothetical protein
MDMKLLAIRDMAGSRKLNARGSRFTGSILEALA